MLEQIIKQRILSHGPINVATFMELALNHPDHGYYVHATPIGSKGDFITAPEISQVFGECISIFAYHIFTQLGSPKEVALVELGPGRGSLMADLLNGSTNFKGFHSSLSIHLVEMNHHLKTEQAQKLERFHQPVSWHDSIDSLPTDRPLIIIANEFFDALPIHQYLYSNGGWVERFIDIDTINERFYFINMPCPSPPTHLPSNLKEGMMLEYAPLAEAIMSTLCSLVATQHGSILVIDYGAPTQPGTNTLHAIKSHQAHGLFDDIGKADITAWVDFSLLQSLARQKLLNSFGPLPQSHFLSRLGILERTKSLMSNASQEEQLLLLSGTKRLLDPNLMGMVFQCFAATSSSITNPYGFL